MPPQSETNCVGQRSMQDFPDKVTSADCNHVKCVLVGDGAVGKTTLVISYTTNGFPTEYVPTAYDNYTVLVMVNNEPIQLQLCDTAGQDDFDLLRPLCYPNTDVFLLCFSIVSPTSFHNVTEKWLPEIRSFCPNVPVILVGTQSDLRSDVKVLIELSQYGEQAISEAEGRTAAKRIGAASYVECSALTQHNLKDVFDIAVKAALVKRGPKSTVVTATGMACVESIVPAVASTSGNRSSQTRSRKSSHHWQSNANNTSRWWKRPFCCC